MTSSPRSSIPNAPDPRHQLSREECRTWLCSHHEGRLDYRTGRGPRSLVVRYTVCAETVLVRVPTYNDLLQYAPGQPIALEVDERCGAREFEHVVVSGTASLVDQDPGALVEDWPTDLPTRLIGLPIKSLHGFVEPVTAPAG